VLASFFYFPAHQLSITLENKFHSLQDTVHTIASGIQMEPKPQHTVFLAFLSSVRERFLFFPELGACNRFEEQMLKVSISGQNKISAEKNVM
jgi:hypothetical protein